MTKQVDMYASNPGRGVHLTPGLVEALAAAWGAIQARHPELPQVVLTVGSGTQGERSGQTRLGHFAAGRWVDVTAGDGGDQADLPELFVGGEGLAQGAEEVMVTLLHEAAHALAHVRGIKDTSRQGRWHNARYRDLAHEVGLDVAQTSRGGWTDTSLTVTNRDTYSDVIATIATAITSHRRPEHLLTGTPKAPGTIALTCGCGRRIRASAGVAAAGPITCGLCGSDFTPDDQ